MDDGTPMQQQPVFGGGGSNNNNAPVLYTSNPQLTVSSTPQFGNTSTSTNNNNAPFVFGEQPPRPSSPVYMIPSESHPTTSASPQFLIPTDNTKPTSPKQPSSTTNSVLVPAEQRRDDALGPMMDAVGGGMSDVDVTPYARVRVRGFGDCGVVR